MSKILLINGSPNKHGCTDAALQEVADTLNNEGVDSEILWLGKKPLQDCIACFKCQLAKNMAYLLKAKQAAEKYGIGQPKYEETVYTNFMD